MLDIGWSELLVVAVVAIVVVGPKELPKLMRTFGFYAGKLRRAASDFQRQFDEAMAESEADEVRKNIESIRSTMGPMDKSLMMPTGGPAQTALGAPPLGAHEVEPPKRTPASGTKRAPARKPAKKPAKTSPKTAKPPRKAAKAKTAPRKAAKAKAKTRPKR
jgi:sec-independent protein translocase protein TatB